ncbi:MAG: Slp family lipoprotein [Candidatus Polarisedimenticolaceae bacterium]|nr:Slp family lipoprotein [Candidatus Polarisedimenticolaceae bacterium]
MKRSIFITLLLLAAVMLTGCSSNAPELIKTTPSSEISVTQAQRGIEPFIGQRVRWGGTIITVENFRDKTVIELLSRPLSKGGEPIGDNPGIGRFLATTAGFIDPTEYPLGRLLTISGRLSKLITRPVGQYPYRYPVVEIDTLYLWPIPQEPPLYYRDPLFDPWYPWHYRPYYYW